MASADDATLVARARAGDRQAFGDLVVRHERAMLAVARAYFASEADAEDAVQEAFLRAFQALDQLRADKSFAGWVVRITVNTCLQILRSSKDKVSLSDFATTVHLFPRVGQEALTPSTLASKREHVDLLAAAVGRLPENQRVALLLRYLEDMTYEQIATYLDVPLPTVRGRLHKAKRNLRRALEGLGVALS